MADANSQPNADPAAIDPSTGKPAVTPSADPAKPAAPAADAPDLKAIPADQLPQVLENPNLFKLPRIADAIAAEKELKDLKAKQQTDKEKSLEDNKKFEDLATERGKQIETLTGQLKTQGINNAVTVALSKESVLDLDAALKLIDRANLDLQDDGTVKGLDDAVKALKDGKAYLFGKPGTQPTVGAPSNPSNTPAPGTVSFKRSQITPSFYKENKEAIDKAYAAGQIENDGPAPQR